MNANPNTTQKKQFVTRGTQNNSSVICNSYIKNTQSKTSAYIINGEMECYVIFRKVISHSGEPKYKLIQMQQN